jgi:hypothetical protein
MNVVGKNAFPIRWTDIVEFAVKYMYSDCVPSSMDEIQ